MKAEEYTERRETVQGWPINIVTYRIGDQYYCTIDNVDPGARITRTEGMSRADVEAHALERANRYLANTRRFSA